MNKESNILYQILNEIIQFSVGKIEISHELIIDLYKDSQNNTTKTIDKLFNIGDNYLFVLVVNGNIELILFLGEYYTNTNTNEIKSYSKNNKNIDYECTPKIIYILCRYIVNYLIGWYKNIRSYFYKMQKDFNFSKMKKIIIFLLSNYYSNIDNNYCSKYLSLSSFDFGYPKIKILEKKYSINNIPIDKIQVELFNKNNVSEIDKVVINKKNFIFYCMI